MDAGTVSPWRLFAAIHGGGITSVLGKQSNEMSAVHLLKTYGLPTLMYGCEAWTLTDSSLHILNIAWNNCFR